MSHPRLHIAERRFADRKVLDHPGRDALLSAMHEVDRGVYGNHHLLGASCDIGRPTILTLRHWFPMSSATSRARFTPAEREGSGWALLAEIGEEPESRLAIGDGGKLMFVIPEPDLLARRFDRVLAVLESH